MPSNQYGSGKSCAALAREDAAYIAGFLDGEGCFSGFMRRQERASRLVLQINVVNTNSRPLFWLAEKTGLGTVTGSDPANAKHSYVSRWSCSAAGAASLAVQVLPWVQIKGAAACTLVWAHCEMVQDPELAHDPFFCEAVVEMFRSLNRRGRSDWSPGRLPWWDGLLDVLVPVADKLVDDELDITDKLSSQRWTQPQWLSAIKGGRVGRNRETVQLRTRKWLKPAST